MFNEDTIYFSSFSFFSKASVHIKLIATAMPEYLFLAMSTSAKSSVWMNPKAHLHPAKTKMFFGTCRFFFDLFFFSLPLCVNGPLDLVCCAYTSCELLPPANEVCGRGNTVYWCVSVHKGVGDTGTIWVGSGTWGVSGQRGVSGPEKCLVLGGICYPFLGLPGPGGGSGPRGGCHGPEGCTGVSPPGRLLLRAIRILLECILVLW